MFLGGAQAQFRFKDEQDWESAVPCLADPSNILSLDCDRLAVAIQCIPVHERLGLDEDLFSVSINLDRAVPELILGSGRAKKVAGKPYLCFSKTFLLSILVKASFKVLNDFCFSR